MCGGGGRGPVETVATPVENTQVAPPPIKDTANIERRAAKKKAQQQGTLLTSGFGSGATIGQKTLLGQ